MLGSDPTKLPPLHVSRFGVITKRNNTGKFRQSASTCSSGGGEMEFSSWISTSTATCDEALVYPTSENSAAGHTPTGSPLRRAQFQD